MKLYVGNLPHAYSEEDLREIFADYDSVTKVQLITDRETGRSRGFGFIELSSEDGKKAIEELHEKPAGGRPLVVNEARPMERRESRGGGGGGGGFNRRDRY